MITFHLLRAGYCTHPEHIVRRGGAWRSIELPALFGVIIHPREGAMLYDTGYSRRFYAATRRFPESLYARITPAYITEQDEALTQLAWLGIAPTDVRHIFISHFHADHIAALHDFPQARLHCWAAAWDSIQGKGRLPNLRQAHLPALLPADTPTRLTPHSPEAASSLSSDYAPFDQGIDVFGDASLMMVELPGHAEGQMGLFVESETGRYFLVADACWQSISYQKLILPHPIAYLLFPHPRLYNLTLEQIHRHHLAQPRHVIIPSHCGIAFEKYGRANGDWQIANRTTG